MIMLVNLMFFVLVDIISQIIDNLLVIIIDCHNLCLQSLFIFLQA